MNEFRQAVILCAFVCAASFFSCAANRTERAEAELASLIENPALDPVSRYAAVNKTANDILDSGDTDGFILFLTDWAENHPDDMYNAYWLLRVAHAYLTEGAEPVAEYYFDRILHTCRDLDVKGNSIHFMCLQNLIQVSKSPRSRIAYFNELINRFPEQVSVTELYLRLALEYEKESEWDSALKAYSLFVAQPDSSTILIAGEPNAYRKAKQLIGYSSSSKNWTFETLDSLVGAVESAIKRYDWRALDAYRARVNFFSMSWKQDEIDPNAQEEFSMRNFMRGNAVKFSDSLDPDSTSTEAYLRTWGWNQYVSTWYLYFRKVNFPVDPDIHGNWEWAGIYVGEKL